MSKYILSIFFKTNLSTFRSAILANDTNKICRILDQERDHISKELDNSGNTALLLAIKYATPLTVRVLLEQGAQPDQTNGINFQTALSLLASVIYENPYSPEAKTALEMATNLLDRGAYIDKPSPYKFTDEDGKDYLVRETPLMTAVRTKNLPLATLFVKRKANVNYTDKQTQNRPIHFAITNSDTPMFDLLENAGASCSVVTNGDNTLLHWFCHNRRNDENIPLLKRLINEGCDVNAENNIHRTPLMLATSLDMVNTCQLLLTAGADINKVDCQGNQAIHLAKQGGECYKLLQQVKQIISKSNRNTDLLLYKKQINTTRSLSQQGINLINSSNNDEEKMKRYSSSAFDTQQNCSYYDHEIDAKHRRMWEKLFQSKQKMRRHRDTSLQRTDDCSQQRTRECSQQRARDRSQQRARDCSEQRTRDHSQQRLNDAFRRDSHMATVL